MPMSSGVPPCADRSFTRQRRSGARGGVSFVAIAVGCTLIAMPSCGSPAPPSQSANSSQVPGLDGRQQTQATATVRGLKEDFKGNIVDGQTEPARVPEGMSKFMALPIEHRDPGYSAPFNRAFHNQDEVTAFSGVVIVQLMGVYEDGQGITRQSGAITVRMENPMEYVAQHDFIRYVENGTIFWVCTGTESDDGFGVISIPVGRVNPDGSRTYNLDGIHLRQQLDGTSTGQYVTGTPQVQKAGTGPSSYTIAGRLNLCTLFTDPLDTAIHKGLSNEDLPPPTPT